ncbi:hypothetical protein [Pseudoclavibacter sp. JSM 162008]|uniref:hypothetical protein n=1 Tax=Pseudoclavibacter sp. JSM 162008 TaxID=3229855 RepID=UPI003526741C
MAAENTQNARTGENPGVTPRRVVLQGAAWTIPVLATAVGAPLVAASTKVPPGITATATHTEWNSEWNHYRTPDNTFRGSSSGSSVAAPTCSYSGDQKQYNGGSQTASP